MFSIKGLSEETINFLGEAVKDFTQSYIEKDPQMDNLTWLGAQFTKRLPNTTEEEAYSLSQQIVDSVDDFDARLKSVNVSCERGGTTEEWLRGRLMEDAKGKDFQEYGNYLEKVHESLAAGNAMMTKALEEPDGTVELSEDAPQEETPPSGTEWNKYTMYTLSEGIDQQAHLACANGFSLPAEAMMPDVPLSPDMLPPEYLDDEPPSELDKGIKIAAAGALTVVSKIKHIPFISNVLPVQGIVDVACWGVEGAKCIGRVIRGDMSISEGLEHMKRVTVSAAANLIHHGVGAQIFKMIPVVGVPISMAVTKVLGSISPRKIQEKLHEGIKAVGSVARDVARGIVSTVKSVATGIKNFVSSLFDW